MADRATSNLIAAVERFKRHYGDNPSYTDVVWKLRQAVNELDLLLASPGRREARAAAMPNAAGQEPTDRREPPLRRQ